MKQADDLFTLELPELGTSLTTAQQLAVQKHEAFHKMYAIVEADRKAKREQPKTYYRFYVKSHDGLTTEWCGLSRKQARDMYAYTDAHQPSNVIAYGWEEQA